MDIAIESNSSFLKPILIDIKKGVLKGENFLTNNVLKIYKMPKVFVSLIKIGEESDLKKSFDFLEKFLKKEYEKTYDKIINYLPMFFMFLISFFMISFVVLVFLPFYNFEF